MAFLSLQVSHGHKRTGTALLVGGLCYASCILLPVHPQSVACMHCIKVMPGLVSFASIIARTEQQFARFRKYAIDPGCFICRHLQHHQHLP
jgi:hypothetical protein